MSVAKHKQLRPEAKAEEKDDMAPGTQHARKDQQNIPNGSQRRQQQQPQQQQQPPQQQQPIEPQERATAPPANIVEQAPAEGAPAEGAPADGEQPSHDLHSPLDRLSRASSRERAPADEYDVSARDVEGVRLGRFDRTIVQQANAMFMATMSTIYTFFNTYVMPYLRPIYNTVTMDGRLWKVMRQGFSNTVDWLFANRQDIMRYLNWMRSVAFTIIKFIVGAVALVISSIARATGFYKDAQEVGFDRGDGAQRQQRQQGQQSMRSGSGSGSAESAVPSQLVDSAVNMVSKGTGMVIGAARSIFNSDVAKVFKNYLTEGRAERYEAPEPQVPAAGQGRPVAADGQGRAHNE